MNYDYYYEESKSEADEIIDEAVDKISSLIKERAKEEINYIQDSYEISKKNYSDAMDKVGELTHQNILKDKEIQRLKDTLESMDSNSLTNLPIKIEDTVWAVSYSHNDHVTCPECNGNRRIEKIIDSIKYTAECPRCSYTIPSDKRFECSHAYNFYKIKQCVIKRITVSLTKDSRTLVYFAEDKGWNGTINKYEEDMIFKFKEDAQDKADRLHKEEKEKAYKSVGRELK